jgi:hypothetical protein
MHTHTQTNTFLVAGEMSLFQVKNEMSISIFSAGVDPGIFWGVGPGSSIIFGF